MKSTDEWEEQDDNDWEEEDDENDGDDYDTNDGDDQDENDTNSSAEELDTNSSGTIPRISKAELSEPFDWKPQPNLKKYLHFEGTMLEHCSSEAQGAIDLCNPAVAPAITEIDEAGFGAGFGLEVATGVRIPKSVKKIGAGAFSQSPKLRHIAYEGTKAEWNAIEKDPFWYEAGPVHAQYVECSDGNILISPLYLTNRNKDLELVNPNFGGAVRIPDGVQRIEEAAGKGHKRITSLFVPASVAQIKNRAFKGCTSLKEVAIQNGLDRIANESFADCTALTSVTLSGSVDYIGEWAFKGCSSLEKITITRGAKRIAYRAFADCTALRSIVLPDGVTEIEDEVFKGCSSLEEISIPASVEQFGENVFADCPRLKAVTVRGKPSPALKQHFGFFSKPKLVVKK